MGNCCSNSEYEKSRILEGREYKKFRKEHFILTDIEFKTKNEILKIYEFIKKIGMGHSSNVFLAENEFKQKVAMKIIKKDFFLNTEDMKKFMYETKIIQNCEHENILNINRIFQTEKRFFLDLEYASEGNIMDIMSKKRLNLEEIKIISAQILNALFYFHKRAIVFRELKCENILVNCFGVIKLRKKTFCKGKSLLTETLQGTLSYLAPEYFKKTKITKKVDFWALGVLLYYIKFHEYPFDSVNPEEIFRKHTKLKLDKKKSSEISKEFKKFIEDLLETDPKKRIGNSLDEFKNHVFFKDLDFNNVLKKKPFSYVKLERDFFEEDSYVYDSNSFNNREHNLDTNFCNQLSFMKSFNSKHYNSDFTKGLGLIKKYSESTDKFEKDEIEVTKSTDNDS